MENITSIKMNENKYIDRYFSVFISFIALPYIYILILSMAVLALDNQLCKLLNLFPSDFHEF